MNIEVTRIELPVKEGHRGRKPVEWRIGDYVIPKSMTCCECNEPKATTKDQFVKLLEKTGLKPEEFDKQYICRSCRSGTKVNKEDVKIDDSTVVDGKVQKLPKNTTTGRFLGLVVKEKLIRFRVSSDMYERGFPINCIKLATEVHDFHLKICLKHPETPVCNENKFKDSPIYESTDMLEVCKEILKEKACVTE